LRDQTKSYFKTAQDHICQAIEGVDGTGFSSTKWSRTGGGGGTTRVLEGGQIYDRVLVGFSEIYGSLSPDSVRTALGRAAPAYETDVPFYATGLSVVLHARSPHIPAVLINYRYFDCAPPPPSSTPLWWFGGIANLTPFYLYEDDCVAFHRAHKAVCDRYDASYYGAFKKACDDFFYIPHRNEHRGVGGIFFDGLNDREPSVLFAFVVDSFEAFLPVYLPMVERRRHLPVTPPQDRWHKLRRGRYVEFNLVYDRGTRFGLKTGANMEAVLASLPPEAAWQYGFEPSLDSEEGRLVQVLKNPRDWT